MIKWIDRALALIEGGDAGKMSRVNSAAVKHITKQIKERKKQIAKIDETAVEEIEKFNDVLIDLEADLIRVPIEVNLTSIDNSNSITNYGVELVEKTILIMDKIADNKKHTASLRATADGDIGKLTAEIACLEKAFAIFE